MRYSARALGAFISWSHLGRLTSRVPKDVVNRYADLEIWLANASIVVLAERHGVTEVLTIDRRHFRALILNVMARTRAQRALHRILGKVWIGQGLPRRSDPEWSPDTLQHFLTQRAGHASY